MKVLKKSDIISLTASEQSLPEEVVKQVVESYWHEVIEAVRNLEHINIFIPEIGELRVAKSKIDKYYQKLLWRSKRRPDLTEVVYPKVEALERLMQVRDAEYAKREKIREIRKTYDQTKSPLAQPGKNP